VLAPRTVRGPGWFATAGQQRPHIRPHEVYGAPVSNGQPSNGRAWLDGGAFGCAVVQLADRYEIRLEGEIDLAARPALDEALQTVLVLDGIGDVALDLDAVTFADSSAVAWLLTADRRIRGRGGQLKIVACSPTVRGLLRLTGIEGRIIVLDRGSMP
jgi:anti-sigma B factor antagonist